MDENARPSIEFPWRRFDGRPLVYASLGTTRAAQPEILYFIAEACNELNLQLVISLGGRGNPEMFEDLPGRPLVVKDAPQLELLKRADIVISHGGLNTVLETLMEGKPIIAIPIAYDQPAGGRSVGMVRSRRGDFHQWAYDETDSYSASKASLQTELSPMPP